MMTTEEIALELVKLEKATPAQGPVNATDAADLYLQFMDKLLKFDETRSVG